MDIQGFRTMLERRKVPAEKLQPALELAQRFEQFAMENGGFSAEAAWAFSKLLIAESQNSEENFITLARFGLFIKSNIIYIAFLEVVDGGEAQENLYRRVAERFGEALRDEVFSGIGIAPFGLPSPEKPRYMQPVIARLEVIVGPEACRALLSDSLRDLPDYAWEREIFQSCANVDEYIAKKKQKFLEQMEACRREGRLFFAQEVTDEVLEFIRNVPEMGGGVRVGNIVYETKIPFLTQAYLDESDPTLKRYYYCHCPWAREAVKSGQPVAPIFCHCSAGFHKKPWEGALGQKVQVDVLESVLQGDDRCRFAIHLPENAG
jgi:predicted hydrocarbon binding protein